MFIKDYPLDKLSSFWGEFLKAKQAYTPNERWEEIVNTNYKNKDFLVLSYDDILYNGYTQKYNEESEKTVVPFISTAFTIILAKKVIIDYGVEMNLPSYEYDTYFESTRLSTLFDRTRDVSELQDKFEDYEKKLTEMFSEETTLASIFTEENNAKQIDELCDNSEYGMQFIDIFTNIIAYDFVKNYLHLNNKRNISDIFNNACTQLNGYDGEYDGVYNSEYPRTDEEAAEYEGDTLK